MLKLRKANERGHADHGWLKSWHMFSFAGYHDPRHMRFRSLRVMNEDIVAPGQGFDTHPHSDMEIVTYVLSGALEHKDSMGNGEILHAGEFQRMSAGTGITHSEFNPSATEPVHLYQIWLFPERKGQPPSYEQKRFSEEGRRNRLQLVASPEAAEGSLAIGLDVRIYLCALESGSVLNHELAATRHVWLQLLRGRIEANGFEMLAGDGAAIGEERCLSLTALEKAEFLLFDLR